MLYGDDNITRLNGVKFETIGDQVLVESHYFISEQELQELEQLSESHSNPYEHLFYTTAVRNARVVGGKPYRGRIMTGKIAFPKGDLIELSNTINNRT